MIETRTGPSRLVRMHRPVHVIIVLFCILGYVLTVPTAAAGATPRSIATKADTSLSRGITSHRSRTTTSATRMIEPAGGHVAPGRELTPYDQDFTGQACRGSGDWREAKRQDASPRSARLAANCIIVQGVSVAITKTADAHVVSGGDTIGFTIIVTSTGDMTAIGVTVTDVLPPSAGLNWTIDPVSSDPGCLIIGGVLGCSFGDLASLQSRRVHITSPTMGLCGTVSNTASVTTANNGSAEASASVVVQCSGLVISKTADSPSVSAGNPIGFTMIISNTGAGTARNVTLTDTLPSGTDIAWSLSLPVSGCSIAGHVLHCSFGDLTSNISRTVHVSSSTTAASCGVYINTAIVQADNQAPVQASASIEVSCPTACPNQIYAVNDRHLADSEFLTIDPLTHAVSPLGPVYRNYDLEGLDLHPTTHVLYATAGSDNLHGLDGYLFIVDRQTGELTAVGPTGYSEVVGLSFRPDGTLWGWSEKNGLIEIDTATGAGTLVFHSRKNIEGLAWNNDGTLLYGTAGRRLYVYNPLENTLSRVASNLPGETEGLEMRPDGLLALGVSGSDTIFAYNVSTRRRVLAEKIDLSSTRYRDVEALAWPGCVMNDGALTSR